MLFLKFACCLLMFLSLIGLGISLIAIGLFAHLHIIGGVSALSFLTIGGIASYRLSEIENGVHR